jgi:protein-S-isoprenylcysteine O-methyltransferase Ste14
LSEVEKEKSVKTSVSPWLAVIIGIIIIALAFWLLWWRPEQNRKRLLLGGQTRLPASVFLVSQG